LLLTSDIVHGELGVLDQARLDVVRASKDSEQAGIGWCLLIGILDQHAHFATGALKPGTRLVREWRGVTHTLLIHTDGIEWRGRRYRSLSVVARTITGARWSGPRFFGLRQQQLDSPSSARAGHGEG
jgi:hypothetical protein